MNISPNMMPAGFDTTRFSGLSYEFEGGIFGTKEVLEISPQLSVTRTIDGVARPSVVADASLGAQLVSALDTLVSSRSSTTPVGATDGGVDGGTASLAFTLDGIKHHQGIVRSDFDNPAFNAVYDLLWTLREPAPS